MALFIKRKQEAILEKQGNTDILHQNGVVKNRHLTPTPEGRFDHLFQIVVEHWHMKQDLLSKVYKALYRTDSVDQLVTLFRAKTILRRRDVNGNVKSNYKSNEDLFLLLVKAFTHVVADDLAEGPQDRDLILNELYIIVHGANKTEKAVLCACSAADIFVGTGTNCDSMLELSKLSINHIKESSTKDLESMVKILKKVQPFTYIKGRSFPKIQKYPKQSSRQERTTNGN